MPHSQAAPHHIETQLAAAEVYGRKGRPLLEAAAVKRAVQLAGRGHPDVHRALVRLGQRGEGAAGCMVQMQPWVGWLGLQVGWLALQYTACRGSVFTGVFVCGCGRQPAEGGSQGEECGNGIAPYLSCQALASGLQRRCCLTSSAVETARGHVLLKQTWQVLGVSF